MIAPAIAAPRYLRCLASASETLKVAITGKATATINKGLSKKFDTFMDYLPCKSSRTAFPAPEIRLTRNLPNGTLNRFVWSPGTKICVGNFPHPLTTAEELDPFKYIFKFLSSGFCHFPQLNMKLRNDNFA